MRKHRLSHRWLLGTCTALLAVFSLNQAKVLSFPANQPEAGSASVGQNLQKTDLEATETPSTPVPDAETSRLLKVAASLPSQGAAPELHEGIWLNTDVPLKLADLRGKVVLLDMWTFGCINCQHVIPWLREWHDAYSQDGLVVIGNHYPEFSYESDLDNLRAALVRLDVPYAVLQDNGRQTWSAYRNRYWPTLYLIDKQGNLRYRHIGEGRYPQTEEVIRALLAEPYTPPAEAAETSEPRKSSLTVAQVVNVRSGPGVEYQQIGTIQPNEAYYVLEEEDGWYRILYDDQTAFVSGELVTVHS